MGTIRAGYPMQVVAADILGALPQSENSNLYILVVADYFTRSMEAFPLLNQVATTIASSLVNEVFFRFSIPEQLHSDQGHQFESKLLHEVCKLLKIHKTSTMPYHPQCDCLVERFTRTLLNMLSTCTTEHPFDWDSHLQEVCMAYNSNVQTSSYIPFYLMFGREICLPIDIMYGTSATQQSSQTQSLEYALQLNNCMQAVYHLVRKRTSSHHQHQKSLYDKKKIHGKPFKSGDLALTCTTTWAIT